MSVVAPSVVVGQQVLNESANSDIHEDYDSHDTFEAGVILGDSATEQLLRPTPGLAST